MHYQYKGRYIMTAVKSGLMIIDQQRADMRIRYERYMEQMSHSTASTQRLLFPEMVEFSPIDCTAAAVVTLAFSNKTFTVFHATNGHRVQMGDGIEAMNRSGIPVKTVSEKEFTEAFNNALSDDKLSEYVSPLISYQASDSNTIEFFIDYDNAFTTKALYRLGFKWPIINEDYLQNVFESLSALAFFDEV